MRTLLTSLLSLSLTLAIAQPKPPEFDWAKRAGGPSIDIGECITVDRWGNTITGGQFQSIADFDPGPGVFNMIPAGHTDGFFMKLGPTGNFLWAKRIGNGKVSFPYDIATDAAGNIYACGNFSETIDMDPGPGVYNLTSSGGPEAYLLKLSPTGDFLWATRIGGAARDYMFSIAVDKQGNTYATGSFEGTVDFDAGTGTLNMTAAGNLDAYVAKFNTSGFLQWAKRIGGTLADHGMEISTDTSGNPYVSGTFGGTVDFDPGTGTSMHTAMGQADLYVIKLNTSGAFQWGRAIGSPTYMIAEGGIAVSPGGFVYVSGTFTGTVDFDPGASVSNLTANGSDFFLLQLSNSGNYLWAKSFGSTETDAGKDVATDHSDNAYVCGFFKGTVDFDPGPNTSNWTGVELDAFIVKVTPQGTLGWAYSAGGSRNDACLALAVGGNGDVFATGEFASPTVDFDPTSDTAILRSTNFFDAFVLKLDESKNNPGLSVFASAQTDEGFQVYPNPVAHMATLRSKDDLLGAEIRLYNIQGQLLQQWSDINGLTHTLDFSLHPAGIMLLEVRYRHGAVSRMQLVKR